MKDICVKGETIMRYKLTVLLSAILAVFIIFTGISAQGTEVPEGSVPYEHQSPEWLRARNTCLTRADVVVCKKCVDDDKCGIPDMLGVNGAAHYRKLTSGCPCEGMTVEDSGCTKKITCHFGDDLDSTVSVTFPCPIVYDPEPKYPLVKMLTGILIEWKQGSVEVSGSVPGTLTYKAPLGKNAPTVVGAEIIEGLSFEITISSVYVGSIWDEAAANAITNGKDALDRVNTAYKLLGGNGHVNMVTPKDIYNSYKANSRLTQAYKVLENRNFGERPWPTYDEFIKGQCKKAQNYGECVAQLRAAGEGHKNASSGDHVYWGNAQTTLIGLYSEVSSHSCHGSSVIGDNGEPAFGILIRSTWCFYAHASFSEAWLWNATIGKDEVGQCCEDGSVVKRNCSTCGGGCDIGPDGQEYCSEPYECGCERYCIVHEYAWATYEWEEMNALGHESTGDCGTCYDFYNWYDGDGNLHFGDVSKISFYQSQPLLVQP